MIGRAAHEAAAQLCPGLHGLPSLHHLGVVLRHLPGAVDAAVGAVGLEGHELDVFGPGLEIVQRGCRAHGVPERRMLGYVRHHLAVDIDGAAVLQRLDVLRPRFTGRHGRLRPFSSFSRDHTSPSTPLMSEAASPPTRWFGRPRLAKATMMASSLGSGASGSVMVMPS